RAGQNHQLWVQPQRLPLDPPVALVAAWARATTCVADGEVSRRAGLERQTIHPPVTAAEPRVDARQPAHRAAITDHHSDSRICSLAAERAPGQVGPAVARPPVPTGSA